MLENNDLGKLIIRLTLGVLILFHGVHKLLNLSIVTGIGGMIAQHHLPSALAYLVLVGEVVAPLMIIFGYFSRIGALIVVINMIVAILLVHLGMFFMLNGQGGWELELQAFYLLTALALVFLGPGKYAINRH